MRFDELVETRSDDELEHNADGRLQMIRAVAIVVALVLEKTAITAHNVLVIESQVSLDFDGHGACRRKVFASHVLQRDELGLRRVHALVHGAKRALTKNAE